MAPASDKLCKCSKSSNHHLEKGDIHDSVAYLGLNKKTLPFSVTDRDADNPLNILPNQEEFAESKGIHIGQEIGRTNCLVTVDEGARDIRPNPGSSTVLVTVRSIAQLDGLDPKSVTLVLTEDESREDRALIVREAKKRHFSLFNDVALQQASLACFMQNLQQQFELIDAGNDSKDANYTPTDEKEKEKETHESVAYLGLNKKTLPFSVTDSDADNPLNILPNQEEFAESKGIHIGQEIGRTNCLVTVDEGARDVRPNPGSSTVLVTVRSIAQLDGLDPKSVTLVLTEDESREDRALIVREAKKRHFSLFNDVTLQQASLACFMQNLQQQFELIDAENDSKDANYTPTDDEEEEEEEKEKLEKDKEKLEKEKKEKEKEKEKEEQEQEQQQEEEEEEKRKEKEQKKEQQYEELDPSYKPDFSDDQELPE